MPASPSQATVEHSRAMLRFGPLALQWFGLMYQNRTSRVLKRAMLHYQSNTCWVSPSLASWNIRTCKTPTLILESPCCSTLCRVGWLVPVPVQPGLPERSLGRECLARQQPHSRPSDCMEHTCRPPHGRKPSLFKEWAFSQHPAGCHASQAGLFALKETSARIQRVQASPSAH